MNYGWNDFWGTSYAERERKKYSNLINAIETDLQVLRTEFDAFILSYDDKLRALNISENISTCEIDAAFSKKSVQCYEGYVSIIQQIESAVSQLEETLQEAERRYDEANAACILEDSEEKERVRKFDWDQ